MDKDKPPPAMGGGGVANRQLPPNRKPNDAKNPKQRRVSQKNFGCYIVLSLGTAPLVENRLVGVRNYLSREQWDWLRWLSSADERWAA